MVNSQFLIISDQCELAKTWVPCLSQLRIHARMASTISLPDPQSMSQLDIVLLDIYTPGFDIASLCRSVRNRYHSIMLAMTYEHDERLHLQLYQNGVDELIVKPLGVPLFLAKVGVWLRRMEHVTHNGEKLQAAHFHLEPNRKRLVIDNGKTMRLSTLECNLLTLLMSNQGHILEPDLIIDRVWPNYGNGDKDLLKNLIYRLRRKIEPDPSAPQYIHTVNGHGYTFRVDNVD
jgi:DNA-binding response OmpR family regulator